MQGSANYNTTLKHVLDKLHKYFHALVGIR